ncbi:endonuclease III [Gemmatimonas sp.]|uniref:endonuclease III n=1 Tax=Gemmatimonas sp. TaxID=1962908 RepID=UPI003983AA2A
MARSTASGAPRQPLSAKKPGKAAQKTIPVHSATAKLSTAKPVVKKATRSMTKTNGQKPSQRAALVSRSPNTKADKLAIATVVLERLKAEYPDAHCELDYRNPFELLCATILSAQCTDVRVNMVTPVLFRRYPNADALSAAKQEDVEEIVRTTGFFRAKAKSLIGMAGMLVAKYDGDVPRTIAELVPLPGVGRKTANVVLGNAFDINEGIVVDTHVQRLARRLGLTREADPIGIERELMPLFPRDDWALLSHLLIWHGRRTCFARKPVCEKCVVKEVCASCETGNCELR